MVSNTKEISSFYTEDQSIKMLYLIVRLQSIKIVVYINPLSTHRVEASLVYIWALGSQEDAEGEIKHKGL